MIWEWRWASTFPSQIRLKPRGMVDKPDIIFRVTVVNSRRRIKYTSTPNTRMKIQMSGSQGFSPQMKAEPFSEIILKQTLMIQSMMTWLMGCITKIIQCWVNKNIHHKTYSCLRAKGFDQDTLVFSMIGVTDSIPQFRNPKNFWRGGLECSDPSAVADSHDTV